MSEPQNIMFELQNSKSNICSEYRETVFCTQAPPSRLRVRQDINMYTYRYCTLYQDCYEFNKYSVKFINTGTDAASADQNRKVQLLVQDDEHGHQNVATQMGTGRAADLEPGFRTQLEAPRMALGHFRTREIDIAVIQTEFPRWWARVPSTPSGSVGTVLFAVSVPVAPSKSATETDSELDFEAPPSTPGGWTHGHGAAPRRS